MVAKIKRTRMKKKGNGKGDGMIRSVPDIDQISPDGAMEAGDPGRSRGRPVNSVSKTMPDYRKLKTGLIEMFNRSDAPAILFQFLNMRLPPMLKPENRGTVTAKEDAAFRRMLLANFKWVVDVVTKVVPKEVGVFGRIEHTSLSGMVKRAETNAKSGNVVKMVRKRRDDDLYNYQAGDDGDGDDAA